MDEFNLSSKPIGMGLVGCGVFGKFCLKHYQSLRVIKLKAVADINLNLAHTTAEHFGIEVCNSAQELFSRKDVELVHIATPPATHYSLVLEALESGKHVLCEKPLATSIKHAEEMIALANQNSRILAVNLIMRYNPLCIVVRDILNEGLLGLPLHAFLENYAKDEHLVPNHWFWDIKQSGGIFIEHGVHFFDLFSMWFGEAKILTAQQITRTNTQPSIIDQVHCTALYEGSVLVNFYHGFHQAERMDRQQICIVCERGDIQLFGWLPIKIKIDMLANAKGKDRILELIPNAQLDSTIEYTGDERKVTSRHKSYTIDGRYIILGDVGMSKEELYGKVLRDLLSDQIAILSNPSHLRRINEQNGLSSLKLAVEATNVALSID
jgi:predicted dehydrogenase